MKIRKLIIPLLVAAMAGCVSVPYRPTEFPPDANTLELRPGEEQVERGRPCLPVDLLGNLWSIPSKIILFNWRVGLHSVTKATEADLSAYLRQNSLTNVKVRINQYAPTREFGRLVRNKHVAWPWRYTAGIVGWVFYTVLPQRVFGGDNYNPWTDTINIYSDIPAVLIHEGGHAKDFAQRTYPGWYGFAYMLPLVALHHEAVATSDALSYLRAHKPAEAEKDAYKILYPAYATYIGGSLGQYVVPGYWSLLAVIPGHIAGRIKAMYVPERPVPPVASNATVTNTAPVLRAPGKEN